ncbi:hypothetical protein GGI24_003599, partial [Coemansia furcata]
MDSGSGLPAFDELPLAYQAQIRDIQQEFMDGDITQKGYDKRMAKIVQDYQSTITAAQEVSDVPKMLSSADRSLTTGGGVGCDFSAMRIGSDSPPPPEETELVSPIGGVQTRPTAVGTRNGVVDTKAFYDARKSTAIGFRKPGINFDALLEDFDDDDMDLQALSKSSSSGQLGATSNGLSQFGFGAGVPPVPAPPVPELPGDNRAAYPAVPSIDVEGAGYDDELTSGRAYNVLSDIMDPYGSQLSRANQELYSDDDSSNDGILDDLDGLSPAGVNSSGISPGIVKQPVPSSETRDALSGASLEPVAIGSHPHLNGGPARGSDYQPARANDLRRQISRQQDDKHLPTDQADVYRSDGDSDAPLPGVALRSGKGSMGIQQPEMLLSVPRSSSTSGVGGPRAGVYDTPSNVSMLTPDTPTVGHFGAANFGSGSTFTDTIRMPKQSGKGRYPENIASLSPVSGIHSAEDNQASSSEVGTSDGSERFGARYSMHSSTTDHAATIASGVGTITLEDMAQAAAGSDPLDCTGFASAPNDRVKDQSPGDEHSISFSRGSGKPDSRVALPDAWVTPRSNSPSGNSPLAADSGPGDDDELGSRSQYSFGVSSGHVASAHIAGNVMAYATESDVAEPPLGAESTSNPIDNVSLRSSVSQHQRPSIQSVAFGSYDEREFNQSEPLTQGQVTAPRGFPYPSDDYGNGHDYGSSDMVMNADAPRQQQQQQQPQAIRSQPSMSTINNRLGRRPTYSTRSDRRPLTSMASGGVIGRASYYAPEAQPEIPANFEMHLLPNIDPAM